MLLVFRLAYPAPPSNLFLRSHLDGSSIPFIGP